MSGLGEVVFSIVGANKTGKTAFVKKFYDDTFTEEYVSSRASQKHTKTLQTNTGFQFNLSFWDTPGEDDPTTQFVVTSNSRGIICAVDSTKILSNDNSDYNQGVRKVELIKERRGNVPSILLATKEDLLSEDQKHQVNESIQKFVADSDGLFINGFLCSAKEGTGLQQAIIYLLQHIN